MKAESVRKVPTREVVAGKLQLLSQSYLASQRQSGQLYIAA